MCNINKFVSMLRMEASTPIDPESNTLLERVKYSLMFTTYNEVKCVYPESEVLKDVLGMTIEGWEHIEDPEIVSSTLHLLAQKFANKELALVRNVEHGIYTIVLAKNIYVYD